MIKSTLTLFFSMVLINFLHAQYLSDSQKAELQKMAIDIEPDSNYTNGNWESLSAVLQGKGMILLGEFDHESKEVFQTRNDLIKFLHTRHGFDVILFESGLGEMGVVDLHQNELSARQMTLGLFGSWRTRSFEALMDYSKRHKISIGGFDVQRTNASLVSQFMRQNLQTIGLDSLHIHDLEKRFTTISSKLRDRKTEFDLIASATQVLIDDFSILDSLLHVFPSPDVEMSILIRTIYNRQEYLKYRLKFLKDKDWHKRWEARDYNMADNVHWLKSHLFPNRKIILVAHNFHIAKHNDKEEVMGEFLKKRYGDDIYVLGFFSGAGSKIKNNGEVASHTAPDSTQLDIKHIVHSLNGRVHFLPIPTIGDDEINWWNTDITINDSFIDVIGSNKMILAKHFDGLLLLDSVSTSVKLW